jgi:hypothetical protein
MEFLFVVILIGLIPAKIAHDKGRSFVVWWIYGSALFIVALPHALIMRSNQIGLDTAHAEQGHRQCPFCAEWIRPEAIVCKHCGRDVAPPKPPTVIDGNFSWLERWEGKHLRR